MPRIDLKNLETDKGLQTNLDGGDVLDPIYGKEGKAQLKSTQQADCKGKTEKPKSIEAPQDSTKVVVLVEKANPSQQPRDDRQKQASNIETRE